MNQLNEGLSAGITGDVLDCILEIFTFSAILAALIGG